MIHKLVIKGKWVQFDDKNLTLWDRQGKVESSKAWRQAIMEREKNPLAYFLPHGSPWHSDSKVVANGQAVLPPSDYPEKWKNDGVAFLNSNHDIEIMMALNQGGKSKIGAVWTALHIIPCDPNWPIFKENGVICRPWTGPKIWTVSSYSWDNVTTLWERYKQTIPRSELRNYSPNWGKFAGERGNPKGLLFGDGKPKRLTLPCGSQLIFLCLTQQQFHWEGFESDGAHHDEQTEYEKWIGWLRGTITRGDHTPCCFTMTPHVIDGRPDTGSAGWIVRDLWRGANTRGKTIGRFHMAVEDVPDEIITRAKKAALWRQWADPSIERSEKDQRAAVARYYGMPEEGGGMIFDEWKRELHVINPLWPDDKTPKENTLYRSIDYGEGGIACCAWFAVLKEGFGVCYRLLYQANMNLFTFATKIVEMSHNKMIPAGDVTDGMGNVFKTFTEDMVGETYYATTMDRRSRNSMRNGESLGDLFARYGILTQEACAEHDSVQIPRLKEWLRIDMGRKHIQLKAKDGKAVMGAPRLYFFDGVCSHAVDEIESLAMDGETGKQDKRCRTHAIDAMKYWASEGPAYWGNDWRPDEDEKGKGKGKWNDREEEGTPYTGW